MMIIFLKQKIRNLSSTISCLETKYFQKSPQDRSAFAISVSNKLKKYKTEIIASVIKWETLYNLHTLKRLKNIF